jgi:signal transduction histidine kinase
VDSKVPKKSLQHTLNNPLAGLLAELQLLQMEELAPEHRAAVGRAVDLVRRLIKIVKEEVPPG